MASSEINHVSHPCIHAGHISAERKFGFMRWITKILKLGSNQGVMNRRSPQFLGEDNVAFHTPVRSMDDHSRSEHEELDRAAALSLADDLKRPNGYRRHTNNDEDLARALQDSLNMPSYPPYAPPQFSPGGYSTYTHVPLRYCSGCNREIGYGKYLGCMQAFWHPECFCCHSCGYPITENEFSLSGKNPYHKSCFKELHHPKCEVCLQFIPTNGAGLIEYKSHPFWCQKYCPLHEYDNTARCCSCERLEGHHHMPETRGLCLSEEQNISSISKRPRIGGNRLIGMKTKQQKLDRKCEVTAILVLYGLPRLLTGQILAHELMHGWLRLKGYRNLSPVVEEGICQVLSYMWLESEVMPGSRNIPSTSAAASSSFSSKKGGKSHTEKKLGEFFMHQIAQDTSTAYGAGFRAANTAVNRYGLRSTLNHIYMTGTFPV
ncbi:PREDICTED: protein DA1-related 2-like isoform X3 [Nelumbo nucifera]|uniref:Protein DA1-related 2-like isoform X3 n=1 Tax=Nelumbo nucifera TaxID=4432 RepID=A0A1U8A608_NELNU|nr:PREDICTED: protein DA1-related 2-like isoform X3 [Nelumbo nucifera]